MNGVEIFSAVMVGFFVFVRARADDHPKDFLLRLLSISVASWIGEQSCITAYGFYAYSREAWTLWVGSVPLAVVVIWPTVIHSAWDLARQMRPAGAALLAACMVFADAWLIEPVSVRAGLWAWTEPGLFEVPPIGVLGWAVFAFYAMALLERGLRGPRLVILVVVAPLLLHPTLLAFWWGAFRWVNGTIPPWAAVGAAWLLSVALSAWVWRRGFGASIQRYALNVRVPAALFFFVLLAAYGRDYPALIAWVVAFVPPWLALLGRTRSRSAR